MDHHFFNICALILSGLILIVLFRALIGPTVIDRLVAVNVIGTKALILLLLVGMLFDRIDMFVDIAIAYGLLNFITSIAAARFFHRTKHIDVAEDTL